MLTLKNNGPFTGEEEDILFQSFFRVATSGHSSVGNWTVFFAAEDRNSFVVMVSLCTLFRWDFYVENRESSFASAHSHDVGFLVIECPDEFVSAIKMLGLVGSESEGSGHAS